MTPSFSTTEAKAARKQSLNDQLLWLRRVSPNSVICASASGSFDLLHTVYIHI
jgi:hypothetical protein